MSPLEAELLKDPTIKAKVKFRYIIERLYCITASKLQKFLDSSTTADLVETDFHQ